MGMIRYLHDVTGLWNMRDTMNPVSLLPRCRSSAPASHRHLVPRWCISANLRSLVLPLSFLPASPLVFPSPFPSHPPPPALSLSSRRISSRSSLSSILLVLEDTWNEKEVCRGGSKVYLGLLNDLIDTI